MKDQVLPFFDEMAVVPLLLHGYSFVLETKKFIIDGNLGSQVLINADSIDDGSPASPTVNDCRSRTIAT